MNRLVAVLVLAAAGCSTEPAAPLPEVHAARGVVTRGGRPEGGGFLRLQATDPGGADHLVFGEVGRDGAFALTTAHALDRANDRKAGAPAGSYRVTYSAATGDQTTGRPTPPVVLPRPVTIGPGENTLVIELPAKK